MCGHLMVNTAKQIEKSLPPRIFVLSFLNFFWSTTPHFMLACLQSALNSHAIAVGKINRTAISVAKHFFSLCLLKIYCSPYQDSGHAPLPTPPRCMLCIHAPRCRPFSTRTLSQLLDHDLRPSAQAGMAISTSPQCSLSSVYAIWNKRIKARRE